MLLLLRFCCSCCWCSSTPHRCARRCTYYSDFFVRAVCAPRIPIGVLVDAPTTLIFFVRAVGAPRPPIGVLDDAPTTPTFLFVLFVLLDSPQVCSTMLLLLLLPHR